VNHIRLENVHKTYRSGAREVRVLKGVSLRVERGEMVAIMGASGAGKTTLINLLGCLDRPTSGRYYLGGEDVSDRSEAERAHLRSQHIGFVFQSCNLLPRTSALDNVCMPLGYAGGRRAGRPEAIALLRRVGLGDRLHHEPSQLSGGEQQRVAIARALVNRPALLIADEPTGNLDSQTSREVLQVFKRLNTEEGLTVLLVTHDPTVAAWADRVVRLCDGVVATPAETTAAPTPPCPLVGPAPTLGAIRRRGAVRGPGFLCHTVGTALTALRRHTLRSALTVLGIIIGVASLIAIAALGRGSARSIKDTLESMGACGIVVEARAATSNGVTLGSVKTLTPEDAEAVLRECPAVRAVAPVVEARQQAIHGNRNWMPLNLLGTTPDYLRVRQWDLSEGEVFSEEDVRSGAQVCVLGRTLVRELFDGASPLGGEVHLNGVPLRVVGVLTAKGTNLIAVDEDDVLIAPLTTIRYRVSGSAAEPRSVAVEPLAQVSRLAQRYPSLERCQFPERSVAQMADTPQVMRFTNAHYLLVRPHTVEDIPAACRQITGLMRERHHIVPGTEDDFRVQDFTAVLRAVESTVCLVQALLVGVALVALVVGGVGIMNVMLVSVTERTREIGLRMAVGASTRDILRQFLVEAVVLSLLGGTAGIAFGVSAAVFLRDVFNCPAEPTVLAVLGAAAVSVAVGIVFGYYPAMRAARLDLILALRYE
jgi:macrolide transport system ATP-binding/permease protein